MSDAIPKSDQDFNDLGAWLTQQGKLEDALIFFRKSLLLNSQNPAAYLNLGNTLARLDRPEDAIWCFQKALQLDPQFFTALHSLGFAYQSLENFTQAIKYYHRALKADAAPADAANIYHHLGAVYYRQGNYKKAQIYFKKAIKTNPQEPGPYYDLSIALFDRQQIPESMQLLENALRKFPKHQRITSILSWYYHLKRQTCDWTGLDRLSRKIDSNLVGEDPFNNLIRKADMATNLQVAKAWSSQIEVKKTSFTFKHNSVNRITLGYLSDGFRDFPTGHKVASLFGLHDRSRFKVLVFSYGPQDGSLILARIKKESDQFIDLQGKSYSQVASEINKRGVDILIDLKGITRGNMIKAAAMRPAPIQVSYLGFPGTTGADFFDYIVVDNIVAPNSADFQEKLVIMPHTYQINDFTQYTGQKKLDRRDFQLPDQAFIFGSFNSPYKLEPPVFKTWMNILTRIPHSVLWQLADNPISTQNLKKYTKPHGVDPRRIIFSPKVTKENHLTRIKLADLCLDTHIVNGHTTTSDCLWAGVPVVCLLGNHFASRVSASILTAIGLPQLITRDLSQYEALAVDLATHPDKLQQIRSVLIRNRKSYPLFDTPRFVKNLEEAYLTIWKSYLQSQKPKNITVTDTGKFVYSPKNTSDFLNLGLTHLIAKDYAAAETNFQKVLQLDPKHELAHFWLGVIKYQSGNLESAKKYLKSTLLLNKDLLDAHLYLGKINTKLKNYAEALSNYKNILKFIPDNLEAQNSYNKVKNLT